MFEKKDIIKAGVLLLGGGALAILVKSLRKPKVQTPLFFPVIGSSISDVEELAIAKSQLQAMDKLGTDEESLFLTLENLTAPDLTKVYNKFGEACYNGYTSCVGLDSVLGGRDLDLFGWYREELDEEEKQTLREIWQKTNIPITF
jgi:hypothetical protein